MANMELWQTKSMAHLILKYFSMMILNWVGTVTINSVSNSCFALLTFTGVVGASGTLMN